MDVIEVAFIGRKSRKRIDMQTRFRVLIAIAVTVGFCCQISHAATVIVNNTADAVLTASIGGNCTFREAIASINAGSTTVNGNDTGCNSFGSAFGTNDRINFSMSLDGQTVTFRIAPIGFVLNTSVEFNSSGRTITLSADNSSRAFVVAGVETNVIFNNVTLTNARVEGVNGSSLFVQGGSSVTIRNSTITGNTAISDSAGGGGAGSIVVSEAGTQLLVENSTISGNVASLGSAILAGAGTSVTIRSSTIADNRVPADANIGGIVALDGSTVVLENTILADSSVADCFVFSGANFSTDSFSIIQNPNMGAASCESNARTGINPNLEPLADNGGPTMTHALGSGSPAFGSGGSCLNVDQRGEPRPASGCDVGAFEDEDEGGESFFVVPIPGRGSVIFTL